MSTCWFTHKRLTTKRCERIPAPAEHLYLGAGRAVHSNYTATYAAARRYDSIWNAAVRKTTKSFLLHNTCRGLCSFVLRSFLQNIRRFSWKKKKTGQMQMCTAWALETLHSICVVTLAIKNRSYRGLNRSHILCLFFFFFNQEFRKLFQFICAIKRPITVSTKRFRITPLTVNLEAFVSIKAL